MSAMLAETFFNTNHHFSVAKPIFLLATLFASREAKTRIRQRDWLKFSGKKIRWEQVGTVPICLFARTNSSSGKYALNKCLCAAFFCL